MPHCHGRFVELDGEPHFVCEICREWCEGPCNGLTDDEVRQWENDRSERTLREDAQDQLRNYHG